ncbi:hypothetical protein HPULCUR_004802 [Helicostylum pulchrum]|uniref:Uncharacterized protein n=1 Tax=Helicostylum pulchrum TaxID=562976 RepID=A0ABP9XZA5_9FUNG
MSTGTELSVLYHNQQQYYNTPIIIAQHQQYRIHNQQATFLNKSPPHNNDQMISQPINYDNNNNNKRQQSHFRVVSPPLSVASTSSSSTNSYYAPANQMNTPNIKLALPAQLPKSSNISSYTNSSQMNQGCRQACWNFTWLVFMNEKWVPFDIINQTKLEQTLTVGGTFVDISDSHFPDVKRVRVFPRNNYLSYLGVKYRLSRIMQPDAYLDHVAVAEAKQPPLPSSQDSTTRIPNQSNSNNNRNRRVWEI